MFLRQLSLIVLLIVQVIPMAIQEKAEAVSVSEAASHILEEIRRLRTSPPEYVSIVHVEECVHELLNDCVARSVQHAKDAALKQGVLQAVNKLNKAYIERLGIGALLNSEISGKWNAPPLIKETISSENKKISVKVEGYISIIVSGSFQDQLVKMQGIGGTGRIENQSADMVKVGSFCIDRKEVSIKEYRTIFPNYQPPNSTYTEDMPVVNIRIAEAEVYAKSTGYRLCTISEWLTALGESPNLEKAVLKAGGPGDVPYEASDESDKNSYGLLNMAGNVSEWVYTDDGRPAHIGGWWYFYMENDLTVESVRKVNIIKTNEETRISIGFRRCGNCP